MTTEACSTKGLSWLPCLSWAQYGKDSIQDVMLPRDGKHVNTAIVIGSNNESKKQQPVGTTPCSTTSLFYPQINLPTTKCSLRREEFQPLMPSGEHNIAARNRIRAKLERRPSRRRSQTNPTQNLRSSRYRSSSETIIDQQPRILQFEELKDINKYSRQSSPPASTRSTIPASPPTDQCQAGCRRKICASKVGTAKQSKHRYCPFPVGQSSISSDRDHELLEGFVAFEEDDICDRPTCNIWGRNLLNALLVSPKTVLPSFTEGLLSPKNVTTFLTSVSVSRKPNDVFSLPVSSSYYLWHILLDDGGQPLLAPVGGRRESRRTVDTPTFGEFRKHQDLDAADAIYHPAMHGRRKYDRDSGFWAWSETSL